MLTPNWKDNYFNLLACMQALKTERDHAVSKYEIALEMLEETCNKVHLLETECERLTKQIMADQYAALKRIDCTEYASCDECPACFSDTDCENAKKTTA